jgi:hypothetical protein
VLIQVELQPATPAHLDEELSAAVDGQLGDEALYLPADRTLGNAKDLGDRLVGLPTGLVPKDRELRWGRHLPPSTATNHAASRTHPRTRHNTLPWWTQSAGLYDPASLPKGAVESLPSRCCAVDTAARVEVGLTTVLYLQRA